MSNHFADRFTQAVKDKGTPICVGLDPRLDQIPSQIKDKNPNPADALLAFNKGIIDAVHDLVPVVKPQVAFYEIYGADGMKAYSETLKYASSKGLITIADVKRNDIGSTAAGYAQAYLEKGAPFEADSLTLNAYLGWDGIEPFVEKARANGKGMFILVKTSNPSSADLQDVQMSDGRTNYEIMGSYVDSWGADDIGESGYSFVGAVVGATFPRQAAKLREIMPNTIFLVPGYGAQGGGAEDVKPCFKDGVGAIVNSSRGITFAYEKMDGFDEKTYAEAARKAVLMMKEDLAGVL
ncbi:orotidine-5'-phosphate decarboxylase [Patescibacteria group bacterium]|nr:orotidine-5'-phosphate decarboxylase [Patescibacteria group bacterium]